MNWEQFGFGCAVFFLWRNSRSGRDAEQKYFNLEDFEEKHLIIVTPDVEISTAKAFELLDAPDLTNKDSKSILKICRDDAQALLLRQTNLVNDFEKTVFKIAPEIERVKEKITSLRSKKLFNVRKRSKCFCRI